MAYLGYVTHTYHELLDIPDNIDIVVHSGDFTNAKDVYKNEPEALNFLHWYGSLPIKNKVLIAGNHDAYTFHMKTKFKEWCVHYNIVYLENSYAEIEGIKFFGSPNTPQFGDWYYMKDRNKMDKLWRQCNNDIDVFVVHGPPKGILDKSYDRNHNLECCGDSSLYNHIVRINPKLCLFGHIHDNNDIINQGTFKMSTMETIFSNGSVVKDRKFGVLSSNGNIFEI